MSVLSDSLRDAGNRTVLDIEDVAAVQPTLKSEVGALLGVDELDNDTIVWASKLSQDILIDTVQRVVETIGNRDPETVLRAGRTGTAVVLLTGIAIGAKVAQPS